MSNILNEFGIASKIKSEIKINIKLFYVFDDKNGINVLFVTNDDKVFGFGQNLFGCCGFGHNCAVKEPHVIPELCDNDIRQFVNGFSFVLALTSDNKLYGWGRNDCGQLATGYTQKRNKYLKPRIVLQLNNEIIVQISCGSLHCLALTSEGVVYGWGSNFGGQVGCGREGGRKISTPVPLMGFAKFLIKSIYWSFCRSYAVTRDGLVYSWGYNYLCLLGQQIDRNECVFKPKLIDITDIMSVCPSSFRTYFLTNDGLIYFCGYSEDPNKCEIFEKLPKLMKIDTKFTSLYSITSYRKGCAVGTGVTKDCVYYLNRNEIKRTEYKTLFKFYSKTIKMCFKTINLSKFVFNGNDLKNGFEYKTFSSNQNRFNQRFKLLSQLGSGAFGTVIKVIDRSTHHLYAVKKIIFDGFDVNVTKHLLREVNTLANTNSYYAVQYYDSWIEDNNCLYIQMELCSDNLKNIIQQKSECFGRKSFEAMNTIEYFISCQLLKEVLECVQYLHESTPPIIHRDLKPHNILIRQKSRDGRFLKICDFGLAKFDGLNDHYYEHHYMYTMLHSINKGTAKYIAPEICRDFGEGKAQYSTKADIFSLSVISQELFDFDINSYENSITNNECLSDKWCALEEQIIKMMSPIYKKRPTCVQLLPLFSEWGIDKIELKQLVAYYQCIKQLKGSSNNFFLKYMIEHIQI